MLTISGCLECNKVVILGLVSWTNHCKYLTRFLRILQSDEQEWCLSVSNISVHVQPPEHSKWCQPSVFFAFFLLFRVLDSEAVPGVVRTYGVRLLQEASCVSGVLRRVTFLNEPAHKAISKLHRIITGVLWVGQGESKWLQISVFFCGSKFQQTL